MRSSSKGAWAFRCFCERLSASPVGSAVCDAPDDEVIRKTGYTRGVEFFDEGGNIVRVVLQVPVHGQDELARCIVKARRQGRCLPKSSGGAE